VRSGSSNGWIWTGIRTSTRLEPLRRLRRTDESRLAFRRALGLTRIEPERRFLRRRLDQL
jgi:RNA polymerase sigma-70 factor, ECF subfamily